MTQSAHWERVYTTHSSNEMSWYEPEPVMSLRLVEAAARSGRDAIIDVGAGASRLVDRLLDDGYSDVTVLDASSAALDETRARLGARASSVAFAVTDLLAFAPDRRYDVWHDRAVFHFLTSADRARYVELASRTVRPGGKLVIGTFAADGPAQCSGLPVSRYVAGDLAIAFAPDFRLLGHEREEHVTPSGATQPFTWANFERSHEMPPVELDSAWHLRIDGDDNERARVQSALLSLSGGGIGTSGGPLLARSRAASWLLADGIYDGTGPETQLLGGPVLSGLEVDVASNRLKRVLDMRNGLLYEYVGDEPNDTVLTRFVSLARPGIIATRTRLAGSRSRDAARLSADAGQGVVDESATADATWMRVVGNAGGIVAAACEASSSGVIDDVVAIAADGDAPPDPQLALGRLADASRDGFDALLEEQRCAWNERWDDADIRITGDDDLQLATRFALFHLNGTAHETDETAVGARGLTGSGYRGHVFWDADVFVLPFFAATRPAFARAMLEYRIRRLPVAQEIARASRRRGARFAWESARSGRDVTPSSARDRAGNLVPIRTGQLEEHIVADVAWAASHYIDWTGDQAFARGPGLTLFVETARYWASRVRFDADGSAHILGVIGPDEYHEPVDNNTFTNVMARWNLRRAATAVDEASGADHGVAPEEPAAWRAVADALVDGYDATTRVYEQFAGFRGLEPMLIENVAPRRPIAADILLGRERVTSSQVIKQADVLMLHHLIPDEVATGSLLPNLRYYEPRTAHGSSLSPGVHASLFARARDSIRALSNLEIASRIDLDDLTGTTASGLHVATMGALWQAFVFGFAGIRPRANRLTIDPWLPESWSALEIRVRFRGARVCIRATTDDLDVISDQPTEIEVGGAVFLATPRGVRFRAGRSRWEVVS